MKNIAGLLGIAAYIFTAIGVVFWVYVVFRLVRYDENYMGWNILLIIPIFAIVLFTSFFKFYAFRDLFSVVLVLFAVVSILAILAMYHFNVLLPYEIWLKRGMPARFF